MSNKQQTALQQAIAHYEDLSLKGSNQAYVVANYLKTLLELEKQQICESFAHGYLDFENTGRAMEVAEQYYKQTYEH